MTTKLWVKISQGLNGTPPKGAVHGISMLEGPDVGSKIEGGAWEDALGKVVLQFRHFRPKGIEVGLIVIVNVRHPQCK
jgi:hypothetical protein